MKKQIKNKNTVRAIAFVLATVVMATSIPMTALAEGENTEEFTLTEENKTSDIDVAKTESNELDGSETKATLDSADLASESVNNMANVIKAENNDLGVKDYADKVGEIYEDLNKASKLTYNISSKEDGEEGYVANLEQQIKNALVAGEKIDNILQGVSEDDGKILVDVPEVDEEGNPVYVTEENGNPLQMTDENGNPLFVTDENGDLVLDEDGNAIPIYVQKTKQIELNESIQPIQDDAFYNDEKTGLNAGLDAVTISQQKAEEANDSNKSVEERKEAKAEAENQLNIADSILKKANEDVDKAQEAKDAAKKKLDEVIKVRDAVLNSTEAAEECYIKGAVKDSEAAFKAIKDAKDKAGELQEEVDELYANIKNLELLEQIQAKQKEVQEIVNDDQDFKFNSAYQKATKELCSLIIQYNILDKDGEAVELGADFEVTLTQHDTEDLQNATLDEKTNMFTLGEKEVPYTQETDDDGWLIFNADMENCFVVKFKDKDGKEYTRYYNYFSNNDGSICVYERSYTVDTEDVDEVPATEEKPGIYGYTDETCIIWKTDDESIVAALNKYIEDIQTDDEGQVLSAKNKDEYNYLKLLENLQKYQEQKEALEKANAELLVAQEKFEALRDQTKKLKMYVYDTKELEYLENQVNIAESALADAKATRDKLTIEIIQTEDIIQRSMIPDPAPSFNLTEKQLETSDGKIAEIVEKDPGVVKLTIEDTGEIKKTSEAPEPVIKTIEPTVDLDLPEERGAGRVKLEVPSGVAGVRVDNDESKEKHKDEIGVKTVDKTDFESQITVAQKDTKKDVTTNKTNINVTDLVNDVPLDEKNSEHSTPWIFLLAVLAAAAVVGAGTTYGLSRRKKAAAVELENMKKNK